MTPKVAHVEMYAQRHTITSTIGIPNIEFFVPKTKQPDEVSCGILSIAYATAIIMGSDPAEVKFKLNKYLKNKTKSLRDHLAKMLSDNVILPFPSCK